jgi:hypothetical protein
MAGRESVRHACVRVLVYTHRWLGIAGAALFVMWFVSGIAMMYARMPRLSAEERLMRAPILDLTAARVDPSAAAASFSDRPQRLRVGMLVDRPVYRFQTGGGWTTVFADTGERLADADAAMALEVARQFAPEHAGTMRLDGRRVEPDQWTLQIRSLLPATTIAVGDGADSYLYIAEGTGEPVLETTRRTRWAGYVSAVCHWIYFTPIRRNGAVWAQLVIWLSAAGSLLCLFGLAWGVWRYSGHSRYRLRGVPHAHSPYAGLMKWHHYTGLVFGLVTFTWVFSGLLSMDPWEWSGSTTPTRAQRDALSGGPMQWDRLTLDGLRQAARALAPGGPVKEIEILQFRGELVAEAFRTPAPGTLQPALDDPGAVVDQRVPLPHALVRVTSPESGTFTTFDAREMEDAAARAMPGVAIEESAWLSSYDSYYYSRARCDREPCLALTLPVLRVKYRDAGATWLYLDPARGSIARKEERLTRLNRWLYHGLHSLDFPWLYDRRPLWDAIVVVLSVGGCIVALTSAPTGWRRLRRHARRLRTLRR